MVKEVQEILDEDPDFDVQIILWDYFGMWSQPMDLDYWIDLECGTIFIDAEADRTPFGLFDGYDPENILNMDGIAAHVLQVEVWETWQTHNTVLLSPEGEVIAKTIIREDNMDDLEPFILNNMN